MMKKMTMSKIYKCDICNKEKEKTELYRLSRTIQDFCFKTNFTKPFDICEHCLERIKKEYTE